ncbi:MAG: hypothetical protein K0S32_1391 [Bacteroidetes bacterium]|jgi:hypothetical protein|nr:hypothetical protein [Bacteroidota bacterium]
MNTELTKKIYDTMVSHQFVVSIMGNIDQHLLLSLLKITDKKLSKMEVDQTMKKRIFHFMIECAQNLSKIDKHQEHQNNSIFLIGKKNEDYMVHIGSIIKSSEKDNIIEIIEQVNAIESDEIKANFYKELTNHEIAQINPFLISLLGISKRNREKIQYESIKVDEQNYFLSFKSTISNLKLTDGIYN